MAELSKAAFDTKYTDAGTGIFKAGQSAGIGSDDMRTEITDVKDSLPFFADLKPVTASGTDTYTVSMATTLTNIANGRLFLILFTNANTGAATLAINALAAIAITKNGTTALVAGDIGAGMILLLSYDGTRLQIVNKTVAGTPLSVAATVASAALRGCGLVPVTIILAPGVNKYHSITKAVVSYKAGAIPFDFSDALILKSVGGDVQFMISGDLNTLSANFDLIKQGQKNVTNVAYVLTTLDGQDATTGDGDIDIKIYYSIEDTNT